MGKYLFPFNICISLDAVLECATLAVVSDEVAVVLCIENIVKFDDVRMIQFLENVDLILQQLIISFVHARHFDDLDGISSLFVIVLAPAVNLTAEPAPDTLV